MINLSIISFILLFLVVGYGGYRQRISVGIGLLLGLGSVAIWQYDVWLSLFLGLVSIQFLISVNNYNSLQGLGIVLGCIGVYGLLFSVLQKWMLIPILWVMVGIGVILSIHSWYVYRCFKKGEKFSSDKVIDMKWLCFELVENNSIMSSGGQGQVNILQAIIALSVSATLALIWLEQYIAWASLLFLWYPLIVCRDNEKDWKDTGPEQGILHSLVAWVCVGFLISPLATGVMVFGIIVVLGYLSWGREWDSNRFRMWDGFIYLWWKVVSRNNIQPLESMALQGKLPERLSKFNERRKLEIWKTRLFGYGVDSFRSITGWWSYSKSNDKDKTMWEHPHNEYICMLFEYGIVGLLLLVFFLGGSGLLLYRGGQEAQALLVVGVTLCSIAFISFPWKWYKESMSRYGVVGYGSPYLLFISLLILAFIKVI